MAGFKIIEPERVVMQPRFAIKVLTLEPQILLDLTDRHLLDRAPRTICCLPNNLAMTISQLQRRTSLVSMEVIDLLLVPFPLVNPR